MNDERFKEEMIRMMGTAINKIDGLDKRLSNVESDVSSLKGDVSSLKGDVSSLKGDVSTLKGDVSTLKSDIAEIKFVQNEHSQILKRLDSKTDSIAEKVLNHEIRITKAEQNIEDLRGGVH